MKNLLTLTRPLLWLDVETHDLVPPEQSRIVEIGLRVIFHDEREDKVWGTLINPGVPISPGATEVHHITDEAVKDAHTFREAAHLLAERMTNVDFGGYHVTFDLLVLMAEMQRAGVAWSPAGAYIIDPLRIWQVKRPRTLSDAVAEFCGRAPTEAHRAGGDVNDVHDVFVAQLELFGDLPRTPARLHALTFSDHVDLGGKFRWKNDRCVITFGKHSGTPLEQLAQGKAGREYLDWLCRADFAADVKKIAADALMGVFPEKGG